MKCGEPSALLSARTTWPDRQRTTSTPLSCSTAATRSGRASATQSTSEPPKPCGRQYAMPARSSAAKLAATRTLCGAAPRLGESALLAQSLLVAANHFRSAAISAAPRRSGAWQPADEPPPDAPRRPRRPQARQVQPGAGVHLVEQAGPLVGRNHPPQICPQHLPRPASAAGGGRPDCRSSASPQPRSRRAGGPGRGTPGTTGGKPVKAGHVLPDAGVDERQRPGRQVAENVVEVEVAMDL